MKKWKHYLSDEIANIINQDPAARSFAQVFFTYSGFHAILAYRIAHWLYVKKRFFMAGLITMWSKALTGIEIHPGAVIGKRLFIDHGCGIVIGETSEIGDDCLMYQGVTLGGTGKDQGKRHPTIGDHVIIGAGAKLLGAIEIGTGAKVGANAVVLQSVPAYRTAVGIPAKLVPNYAHKVAQ